MPPGQTQPPTDFTSHRWWLRLGVLACLGVLATGCASSGRLTTPLPATSAVGSASFAQATGSLLGATFLPGNRIATLNDGPEIYTSMLAEIRRAKRTITFETYVFHDSPISQEFVDALSERARAGVAVKMILDAIGGSGSGRFHAVLRNAGVQLAIYHPVLSPDFWRFNHRTHRKLMVVDGRVGFIGGAGIGLEWRSSTASQDWRELHYRIEGPAVAQMQAAFGANWFKLTGEVLLGPKFFPALPPVGSARAGVFYSAPYRGRYGVGLMFHLAIAGARKSILIENPYFVPDESLTTALCSAAQRGVKVQGIMAGPNVDFSPVRVASRARWPRLRAAGVELYEYSERMLHAKLLVVDGLFVSVGSANFDPRSLAINDEANLNVLDAGFASEQARIFQRDLLRSRTARAAPLTLRGVSQLPFLLLESQF
jgi:cardiolipin synthase